MKSLTSIERRVKNECTNPPTPYNIPLWHRHGKFYLSEATHRPKLRRLIGRLDPQLDMGAIFQAPASLPPQKRPFVTTAYAFVL